MIGTIQSVAAPVEAWPALPLHEWRETCDTLHMWTQIVGKVRLALSPPINHWWHTALYVTARGLSTGPMPCGDRTLEILFDLVEHDLTIEREAYSHECISHGFWPGGNWFGKELAEPIYYSYTIPAPLGLSEAKIQPAAASFNAELGEFVLNYEDVRRSPAPRQALKEFLQSTYEAGADRAGWDRASLERH